MTVGSERTSLLVPLWRNRDYLLLWTGRTVSSLGSSVSIIAFPLLILALTHSPAKAGFAGALRAAPYIIFSLPAGALVDRWNRKTVMVTCDTGRALALGSIPVALWTGHLTLAQLYLATVVEGTLFVFFQLAEMAALLQLVPQEQLAAATAQNEAAYYGVAALLGPALGGVLYQIGRAVPFVVDAISYAASVFSLLFIKTAFQRERTTATSSILRQIREGLTWLWRHSLIRTMALLTSGYAAVGSGLYLILIVLAKQQHASPAGIGAMFSIAAVGGIAGSLVGGRIQRWFSFSQVILGVRWASVPLWLLYAVAPNPFVLGIITAGMYVLIPMYNVVQLSYLLPSVPEHLRGRVGSVFQLVVTASQPLGLALTGLLLQWIGAITTVLVLGVWLFGLAVAATLSPAVRHAPPIAGDAAIEPVHSTHPAL